MFADPGLHDPEPSSSEPMTLKLSGCLRSGLSWFNWWVSFAPDIQTLCPHVCFILDLILISMFLR